MPFYLAVKAKAENKPKKQRIWERVYSRIREKEEPREGTDQQTAPTSPNSTSARSLRKPGQRSPSTRPSAFVSHTQSRAAHRKATQRKSTTREPGNGTVVDELERKVAEMSVELSNLHEQVRAATELYNKEMTARVAAEARVRELETQVQAYKLEVTTLSGQLTSRTRALQQKSQQNYNLTHLKV